MSKLLDNLIGEFAKLPGVGRRSALRLALHLLRQESEESDDLAAAIYNFRRNIKHCKYCNNLTDGDVCPVCADPRRDISTICVVEQVGDLISIENTGQYNGLYFVLGGVISPMQGISPSDLKIEKLIENITEKKSREVVLALSTTIEGETTAFYISRKLAPLEVSVSAIARGIGFGDELEYADELTITHALRNRKPL